MGGSEKSICELHGASKLQRRVTWLNIGQWNASRFMAQQISILKKNISDVEIDCKLSLTDIINTVWLTVSQHKTKKIYTINTASASKRCQ